MIASEPRWWEEPLRIFDFQYLMEIETIDFRDYVRMVRDMHANVVHFHCTDCNGGGADEESFYFTTRLSKRARRDVLAEALPLLHEAGIRAVVYLVGHWFPKPFAAMHPDWWVIRADGTRVENFYGDDDATFCLNSPWRDWMHVLLEDLCAYDIDGLFFDGPIANLRSEACYCPACKAKFRSLFGREAPLEDRTEPDNQRLLRAFSELSCVDFYRDAYTLIKKLRPTAAVYLNAGCLGEPGWHVGRSNRRLMPYQDLLLAEGGFMYGRLDRNPMKTAASTKLYAVQATGKPCANAVSPAYGGWRRHSLSAPEIRILLSEASCGCNPYIAAWIESIQAPGIKAAGEVYGFIERHAAYYRQTRSGANVALVYSQQTVDNYTGVDIPWADMSRQDAAKAHAVGNFTRSLMGFYELLRRARVPFDIIDESEMAGAGLERYRMLVLPNCACLSDAQCQLLHAWTERGGRLIADFETSHYDENGTRRPDLGLEATLGVRSLNTAQGPRRTDFAFVEPPVASYLAALPDEAFPATRHSLVVKATDGRAVALFGKPMVSNVSAVFERSDAPFLVENACGAGKSFYFAGTFGEAYAEFQFTPYLQIFRAILRAEITPAATLDGPPHIISVNLREQPALGRALLHLVNYEDRAIEQVIPALDLRVTVQVPRQAQSVRALKLGLDLPFARAGEALTFALPRLDEYEVIAIE